MVGTAPLRSLTTPSSESNKLRSIISNPIPGQKIAIEKVQNYMDVQAIDNDIQSHISANPSENAEHLNKWLHEKYKGSKLESQLPTLDHIKYKLRPVKDALGYSSIDYVKSQSISKILRQGMLFFEV